MRTLLFRFGLAVLVGCVAVGSAQAFGFGSAAMNGYGGFSVRANSGFSAAAYQGFGAGGYSFSGNGGFINRGGGGFLYSGPNVGRYTYGDLADGIGTLPPGGAGGSWSSFGGSSLSVSGTRGAAVGPYGGVVVGGTRTSIAPVLGGTGAGGARWSTTGTRFPTDIGLANYYSTGGYGAVAHSTAFWSNSYITNRAALVRNGFAAYNSFSPDWYTLHPAAWVAADWAANAAWKPATWPSVANFVNISGAPVYLDYGNTIVFQGADVYVNGTNEGTAAQYNQQAAALAVAGQEAKSPKTDKWQALGVFALAQGKERTSNTMFQLAVNKDGIIRGNYYDAIMDINTEVYGSVDPKTQRVAWTIGKNQNTVYDTGIYNLTSGQTPVLVHFGKENTQQWLLVRVEKPEP